MPQRIVAVVSFLVIITLGTGCAGALPLRTVSGLPEVVVSGSDRDMLVSVLTEAMLANDFVPVISSDRLAIYERPLAGVDSFLLGPGFSTDADLRVTCCLIDDPVGIHLISDLEIVRDAGTADERRKQAPKGHDAAHELQDILDLVKGTLAMRLHELAWPEEDVRPDGPEVWSGD